MRTVEQTLAVLRRKLAEHWHIWLTVESGTPSPSAPGGPTESPAEELLAAALPAAFPLTLPLGQTAAADLAADFVQINRDALDWVEFAKAHHLDVQWTNRRVRGSTQEIATHVTVADLTQAGALVGAPWPAQLDTARKRLGELTARFGSIPAPLLRSVAGLGEIDFQMLCTTAEWLRTNDASGLTARQVPIEGVHGKWLNTHHRELLVLSGRDNLGLVERPSHIRYRYLDPRYLSAGGRVHDSHTLGDSSRPAYEPAVAIISENKDTALLFPEAEGAISVFGNGYAAVRQLPRVPWLREIPTLVYWGDLDAEAFEIVDGLRAAGLNITTILMDEDAYEQYEQYGSWTDAAGKPLKARDGKALANLTGPEQAVYQHLVEPVWARVRRIEQERIPLDHALAALRAVAPADRPVLSGT